MKRKVKEEEEELEAEDRKERKGRHPRRRALTRVYPSLFLSAGTCLNNIIAFDDRPIPPTFQHATETSENSVTHPSPLS